MFATCDFHESLQVSWYLPLFSAAVISRSLHKHKQQGGTTSIYPQSHFLHPQLVLYKLLCDFILEATLTQLPQSTCYNTYLQYPADTACCYSFNAAVFVLTVTSEIFLHHECHSARSHSLGCLRWKLAERKQFTPLGV